MAKVKEFTVSKSVKISYNYNSVDVVFGVTMELDPNEDLDIAISEGWELLEKELGPKVNESIQTLYQLSEVR